MDGEYVAIRVASGDGARSDRRSGPTALPAAMSRIRSKRKLLRRVARAPMNRERSKPVNTILSGGKSLGTTTDGAGARSAIEAVLDEPVALKRVGILGYGATAARSFRLAENDAYTFVGGATTRASQTCRRFRSQPWPRSNPPEIVVSTLPPGRLRPTIFIARRLQNADMVMDANYGDRSRPPRRINREYSRRRDAGGSTRASFDFWLAHIDRVGGG